MHRAALSIFAAAFSASGQLNDLAPDIPDPAGDLRVMVWNVQRGSNNFDQGPEKTLAWIRAAAPDVVLMQESYDIDGERPTLGRWLAEELGWSVHQGESPHLCVLTHLTIEETYFHEAWHALGARLRDEHGAFLAYSIWIDWRAYTPYALRDDPDATDDDLLANETERSDRLEQATAIIDHLEEEGHIGGDLPLLVGGDWNCPSHLDWTRDASLVYRFRRALPLPVSLAMQDAGFEDAFRTVNPDPVNHPGITWSPLDRGTPETPGTADRIDRLYTMPGADGASLEPVAALTLPLELEDHAIAQEDRRFPSDHAAVIIDLSWR